MRTRSRIGLAGGILLPATAAVGLLRTEPAEPLTVGPIAYFQAHCARCHGPVDSPENTAFEKALPDADLRKTVEDMAAGPGGSALSGKDLDALVALHRASTAKRPFLAWTKVEGHRLTGETLPGSVVVLKGPKGQAKATVSGFTWSASPAEGDSPATVSVVATRNGKRVVLVLAKGAFTLR